MKKLFNRLFVATGITKLENFCWILAFSLVGLYAVFALNDIITTLEWIFNVHF